MKFYFSNSYNLGGIKCLKAEIYVKFENYCEILFLTHFSLFLLSVKFNNSVKVRDRFLHYRYLHYIDIRTG